ncbi:MAG: 50S ribosomal protein L19 [Candidatus Doudnabacteria bacterium]|nr:50S ribosomal protein L19 [Candidatus Doudnabacteria bacterium]
MTQVVARQSYLNDSLPDFSSGDTVRVYQRIKEGDKERIQIFEGLVLGRHGGRGINATFTVRKTSSGIGVERIYPLHSPNITKLEVVKPGRVRKAQLTYVRNRSDGAPRFRKSRR